MTAGEAIAEAAYGWLTMGVPSSELVESEISLNTKNADEIARVALDELQRAIRRDPVAVLRELGLEQDERLAKLRRLLESVQDEDLPVEAAVNIGLARLLLTGARPVFAVVEHPTEPEGDSE